MESSRLLFTHPSPGTFSTSIWLRCALRKHSYVWPQEPFLDTFSDSESVPSLISVLTWSRTPRFSESIVSSIEFVVCWFWLWAVTAECWMAELEFSLCKSWGFSNRLVRYGLEKAKGTLQCISMKSEPEYHSSIFLTSCTGTDLSGTSCFLHLQYLLSWGTK